ncbi:MAG TPA: hypothetical protein VHZ07_15025 [Bryobacteraceae bacterium]|jgi:hypothetical protein|nr:hypothetical protein [Bryobacteraceae bacterium]
MSHPEKPPKDVPEEQKSYRGYAGLPPLAGICSMNEALTKGLTVQESVGRLKRLHWALKRLHGIFIFRITATPIYELKMAFSLHSHYCAEHVSDIAKRVREMRQPPYGLDLSPDPFLDLFFDEILAAPELLPLLIGLYDYALPAVIRALQRLMDDTNTLFDHPTYRIARFALVEAQEMLEYGQRAIACLDDAEQRKSLAAWERTLERALQGAGELDGTIEPAQEKVERVFSGTPYKYDPVPRRDDRFKDSYNMGVNAEAMLFDPDVEPLPKTIMLYFKRLREIDVPEMMASILAEKPDKPWDYYRAMTRQLWDEARHAMMGEIGFVSMGIDWTGIPLNFTWSLGLNTKLTAKERHAVLFTIEQGLMPKTIGKEFEWRVARATENRLTALIQDYDWADEILHARIGRDWIVPELGSQAQAQAYGDEAWSRILVDWTKWREEGLTEHRNWWPDVYTAACKHWGITPDPKLLKYNTTYESTRADLKHVAG